MRKPSKTPWPTEAVMNQIYEQHFWGGNRFDFYSGEGSHDPKIIVPYLEAVTSFLTSHHPTLTVCDLGCGDFNIGKHLTKHTKTYIAVDIVDRLIERNKTKFKEAHLEFQCLDIANDQLPAADCVIIRQVFQHLSNAEINSVIKKLSCYKYIIITEHIPNGHFNPNKDIISGQGIRLKHNSGVDLLKAPFNLKITEQSLLNTYVLEYNKGQILTTLYTL
ncbi:class I SAM-dependent methyltransferase [Psychroserpens sp. SPM9]|uniref:class I SAM-dependent methyltransferase n=1 Tax=Psychroserpens sp. SPM9 TaxID=2975598 RepID=UPI0021A63407|nr:class I SAM-dependent methyltransferase [Psychroserpens sp. SPM9]MDG5490088.1 class I SAM-dependent methyltransferase [Psychroserpens sp. SPM9]